MAAPLGPAAAPSCGHDTASADRQAGSSDADLVSRGYFDAVLERVHLPEAAHLYGFREVNQVLNDQIRFARPVPRINASPESLRILSNWTVFRHDMAQQELRTLLLTCLMDGVSCNVFQSLDDKIRRVVVASVGMGQVEACAGLSNVLTHMLVSDICNLPQERVRELHVASELIDMFAGPSVAAAEVDHAVLLFCSAATESPLFEAAMRTARETNLSLDRETIVHNVGMLLYAFFGPLPAALSNLVLAMSLNDGWNNDAIPLAQGWLHESLRLYSPTAAVDRIATDDVAVGVVVFLSESVNFSVF